MITIVDYGMGNLRSVAKAIEKVGSRPQITSRPEEVARAERLILPGVGAFRDAIGRLREDDLVEPIRDFIATGRPFLGICLGLQLLFERSYEDGVFDGLGLVGGEVVRFDREPHIGGAALKVPHMGWNQLQVRREAPILRGLPDSPSVYFVHSYYVRPKSADVIATQTDYGRPFVSMIWQDNILATQFHPEKSQKVGLAMLKNFTEM